MVALLAAKKDITGILAIMSMNVRLVLTHACLVHLKQPAKPVNPVTGEVVVKIAVKDVRTIV